MCDERYSQPGNGWFKKVGVLGLSYPTLVVTTGTILQTHGIPIHTDTVTLCDDGSL